MSGVTSRSSTGSKARPPLDQEARKDGHRAAARGAGRGAEDVHQPDVAAAPQERVAVFADPPAETLGRSDGA
jgi:hypothetical protein